MRIPGTDASGNANPYPSAINVAGFTNGAITDINLTLHEYSHTFPRDADVLLVLAQLPGVNAIVMSDACGDEAVNITLTLDDQSAASLPGNSSCISGTFQPTNAATGDGSAAPAPIPSGNSLLGVFDDANPNGSWQLFVMDDGLAQEDVDFGQFAGGWMLQIMALTDVEVEERGPVKKKGGKKGRR